MSDQSCPTLMKSWLSHVELYVNESGRRPSFELPDHSNQGLSFLGMAAVVQRESV